MTGAPAALYVDFDNVFSGLLEQDEGAALRFAEHPEAWLPRLTEELGGPRWLHLRCYVNAGGSARHPRPDEPRIPFLPFRRHFARAGFEVVDCPPLTPQLKNAADIRLAVDAMDALHGPARVEEFVVASSDSDFTPLLTRLRAADRRTTLVTTFEPAEALTAAAGRHLDRDALLALVIGHRASPAPSDGRSLPPGWTA
ncbi:MAG: NYN domain-containing protein, partial [Nocardioidaceae bacterium]|nr:NYN domain-containing protein [Nocardioidaceae bacterium]